MLAISVIVPIYNMEKLMHKCIDSILAQTFKDFEILLIDDGSTDRSAMICDKYQHKDPRIKVYHKANGGLSDARNYGLKRANGIYVIFFDPDDWVDSTCLEELYEKAQESDADVVMCDIFYNDKYRQRYGSQKPSALRNESILKDLIVGKVSGFTVTKLIRKECYTKYEVEFPVGIYGCEDQYAMCILFKNNVKIAYIERAFYHYMYYGNNTLSRSYDENTLKQDIKIRDMFTTLLGDTGLKDEAYRQKTNAIVTRAFLYGNKVYSSKDFVKKFMPYRNLYLSQSLPGFEYFLYHCAFRGWYQQARFLYGICFSLKQVYKKVRYGMLNNITKR